MPDMSIKGNDARITVIGKSWPDGNTDSGDGEWLEDLGDLDPLDVGWEDEIVDPDTLPDEIEIITQPQRLRYVDGERINLTGMKVLAKKDGATWTSEKYKNGMIPLAELYLSPGVASVIGAEPSGEYTDGEINCMLFSTDNVDEGKGAASSLITHYDGRVIGMNSGLPAVLGFSLLKSKPQYTYSAYLTLYEKNGIVMLAGLLAECSDPSVVPTYGLAAYLEQAQAYIGTMVSNIKIKAGNFKDFGSADFTHITLPSIIPISTADPVGHSAEDLHPAGTYIQTINVFWERPEDKIILSTSFKIIVTEASGHTHHSGTF